MHSETTMNQNLLGGVPQTPPSVPSSAPASHRPVSKKKSSSSSKVSGRPQGAPSAYMDIGNLDVFFERVYFHWANKGFAVIFVRNFFNLLTLAFVILFSTILTLIDYRALFLEQVLTLRIFTDTELNLLSISYLLIAFYFLVFTGVWIWQAVRSLIEIVHHFKMMSFFLNKLHITERQILTASWNEVVGSLMQLQSRERFCRPKRTINELDIVRMIMRKDNYLIALYNQDAINFSLPIPGFTSKQFLTHWMERCLDFSLLGFIFEPHGRVKAGVYDRDSRENLIRKLRIRFVFFGILTIVLTPFILVFELWYLFFKYGEELHQKPSVLLGMRVWTPYAHWTMREFNELPHVFNKRMVASQHDARRYIEQFPSPILSTVVKFLAFVMGSISAVILLIGLVEESVLLQTEFLWRPLFWYLTIFGVLLGISRAFVDDVNIIFEPEVVMRNMLKYTHYMPKKWRGRAHTYEVLGEFSSLFQFRVLDAVQEIASVLLTPAVLFVTLPRCAPQILEVVASTSVPMYSEVEALGYVCCYSNFDFDEYGNSMYGSRNRAPKYRRSRQGKLEKSFLNFKLQYPNWLVPESAQDLLKRLEYWKEHGRTEEDRSAERGGQALASSDSALFSLGLSQLGYDVMQSTFIVGTKNLPRTEALFLLLDKYYESQWKRMVEGSSTILQDIPFMPEDEGQSVHLAPQIQAVPVSAAPSGGPLAHLRFAAAPSSESLNSNDPDDQPENGGSRAGYVRMEDGETFGGGDQAIADGDL